MFIHHFLDHFMFYLFNSEISRYVYQFKELKKKKKLREINHLSDTRNQGKPSKAIKTCPVPEKWCIHLVRTWVAEEQREDIKVEMPTYRPWDSGQQTVETNTFYTSFKRKSNCSHKNI